MPVHLMAVLAVLRAGPTDPARTAVLAQAERVSTAPAAAMALPGLQALPACRDLHPRAQPRLAVAEAVSVKAGSPVSMGGPAVAAAGERLTDCRLTAAHLAAMVRTAPTEVTALPGRRATPVRMAPIPHRSFY